MVESKARRDVGYITEGAQDLLIEFYANGNRSEIIRSSKSQEEANSFQELRDAGLVEGESDSSGRLIVMFKVLPLGMKWANEIIDSRMIPVLKRLSESGAFPISVDERDADSEVYMRLNNVGMIRAFCADDRVYAIGEITEEGLSAIKDSNQDRSKKVPSGGKIAGLFGHILGGIIDETMNKS